MAKTSILIALLLQLCTMIQGLVPCSEHYSLTVISGSNETLGQIKILSPSSKLPPYDLKVGFNTNAAIHRTQPVAEIQLPYQSVQDIEKDKPLLFRIYFPVSQPIPRLTKISFNNQQICPDSGQTGDTTTVEIERIFEQLPISTSTLLPPTTVFINHNDNDRPKVIRPRSLPGQDIHRDNSECGFSRYADRTNLLISNGNKTKPGQWPWVVAIFVLRINHEFACGGSILSNKHVLTAAHCLKIGKESNDTLYPNVLVVALGRFNLTQWREGGTENREVASFKIHPDYTHTISGDSDLAILTLRTPVEFNEFIKPICLWSGPTELTRVVNKTGFVVGWGQDELGNPYTEDPRMARVPIVDQERCLRSFWIFASLTTDRTFCAGAHGGSGPCNGDSGSGLVLFDANTFRFRLRGVVSRSVLNDELQCDLTKFVVFVDVAKYLPWIHQQISTTINNNVLLDNVEPQQSIENSNGDNNNDECGISNFTASPTFLIVNRQRIMPGQWPWMVALYLKEKQYEFRCAGSLLTKKHILTTASCLMLRYIGIETIDPNMLKVTLGRFSLHQFREGGTVNRKVANHTIHPDFKHKFTADYDLAILILRTPVEYNHFIKPICLWSGPPSLQNVVNSTGYVVGWSKDESSYRYTGEPRIAMMPIVSQETCHRSDPMFVTKTSNRTFCAGNGSDPCIYVIGSGLVLFDANTNRFQLRGVVSRLLYNNEHQCDPTKFVIFADVAKYLPWIHQQISTT